MIKNLRGRYQIRLFLYTKKMKFEDHQARKLGKIKVYSIPTPLTGNMPVVCNQVTIKMKMEEPDLYSCPNLRPNFLLLRKALIMTLPNIT